MTDFHECDGRRFAGVTRPETDLSEGNASTHRSEDYRPTAAVEPDPGLFIDPDTGAPIVLP